MKNNIILLIVSLIINSLITLYSFSSEQYDGLGIIFLIALAISVIGFVCMLSNKLKIGGILYSIGCVAFVPIGLIGIVGVRKVMNEKKEQNFIAQEYGSN